MTTQTPTRAKAEAWMKRGSVPLHWGIIASADDVLEKLKSCNCGQCDTIRAEMLAYRECVACKQIKNKFTDASVCDECLDADSDRVEEQYLLLSQPDGIALCYDNHIADPNNMAGVVQPERFADDGKAIKHDSDKTRYSLLPWEVMEPLLARASELMDNDHSSDHFAGEIDNQMAHVTAKWFDVALNAICLMEGRNNIKLLWGVHPWPALRAVAEVFTSGAKTYGDDNWKRGLSETRRLDACRRHWAAYCCGEEMSEHGHHHLAHVLWYGLVGMWYDAQEGK